MIYLNVGAKFLLSWLESHCYRHWLFTRSQSQKHIPKICEIQQNLHGNYPSSTISGIIMDHYPTIMNHYPTIMDHWILIILCLTKSGFSWRSWCLHRWVASMSPPSRDPLTWRRHPPARCSPAAADSPNDLDGEDGGEMVMFCVFSSFKTKL